MRNQPPQSYNNDEMTVLLDSDTQSRARIHSFPLLPLPIFNATISFASARLLRCVTLLCACDWPPSVAGPFPPSLQRRPLALARDDDPFFPQNIDPDYHESSRLLASTVLIEPDRQHLLICPFFCTVQFSNVGAVSLEFETDGRTRLLHLHVSPPPV